MPCAVANRPHAVGTRVRLREDAHPNVWNLYRDAGSPELVVLRYVPAGWGHNENLGPGYYVFERWANGAWHAFVEAFDN